MSILIIIGIVVFFVIFFLPSYDTDHKSSEDRQTLKSKYPLLVKMLHADSNPKEFKSTSETYMFGWLTNNADNRFTIKQMVGSLNIQWNFKGKLAWENRNIALEKEWVFPEHRDEEEMAKQVLIEMTDVFNKSELGQY